MVRDTIQAKHSARRDCAEEEWLQTDHSRKMESNANVLTIQRYQRIVMYLQEMALFQ